MIAEEHCIPTFNRKFKPYLVTFCSILGTGYLKIALSHMLHIESPILLFFAAITISAWYGGARQGLLAIFSSLAFIVYYFILPSETIEPHVWFLRLVLYFIDAGVIVFLCSRLRTSKARVDAAFREIKSVERSLRESEDRLRHTADELAEVNSQLEERVADRTRQLTETNKKLFQTVVQSEEATERLRESQSFLDSVVENIPNMIFVKEADNLRFVRFNKAGSDLIGQKSESLIGKNDYDFFPKEEADFFISKDREVLKSGVMKEIFEETLSTPKGLRFLHTKKIPIFDKYGKTQYLLGISEDITEKKAIDQQRNDYIQAQLARSEAEKTAARLEFLSEASVNLSKSLDIHTMLNAFSMTVTKSFADACLIDFYDVDENSVERIVTAYLESVSQPALEDWSRKNKIESAEKPDAISKVIKSGVTQIFNNADGELLLQTLKDVELTNKLLQNGNASILVSPLIYHGQVFGTLTLVSGNPGRTYGELDLSIAEDLAKRASFAIENARLFQKANEASRAKSAFLANISHEIRTPLGAMLGFADLALGTGDELPQEQKEHISKVLRNGEQLLHIVDEVLDLSKAESDQILIEKMSFSLTKILDEVSALLMINAKDRGLKLKITKPQDMPEKITTDPLRLRQILINIIGNAIKFTEKGEIEVLVHFPKVGSKSYLQLTIKDTGIGITAEQAAKLFQPFVQADSSMTRKFGGTGLGLFLSRKLARLLGGDVILQSSSLGKGSQFEVTIDISTSLNRENMQKTNSETSKPTAKTSPVQGGTILVVDDSEDNRDLISAYLDKSKIKYDLAQNGLEGVEKAMEKDYDIILMDIQMPKMDGFEAVQYLRDRHYVKPIVAVTAHAMKGYRERCLNSGFDDYLCKPLAWDALMNCVNKFMIKENTPKEVDNGI